MPLPGSPAVRRWQEDIVHIEGGFTVDYTGRSSPNFGRICVRGQYRRIIVPDGTLNVSGGQITVNANAAGAFVIGRSDNSVGILNISGGMVSGSRQQNRCRHCRVGFGMNSTGSVTISGGELRLASGVVIGFGDNSTGHFTLSEARSRWETMPKAVPLASEAAIPSLLSPPPMSRPAVP